MSRKEMSETQMENLLDAITNALLVDQNEVEPVIHRYGAEPAEVNPFVNLIQDLRTTLHSQEPRETFIQSLKADLTGKKKAVSGLRRFPMRARIAAVLAAMAAGILLMRRRSNETGFIEGLDIPILQQ